MLNVLSDVSLNQSNLNDETLKHDETIKLEDETLKLDDEPNLKKHDNNLIGKQQDECTQSFNSNSSDPTIKDSQFPGSSTSTFDIFDPSTVKSEDIQSVKPLDWENVQTLDRATLKIKKKEKIPSTPRHTAPNNQNNSTKKVHSHHGISLTSTISSIKPLSYIKDALISAKLIQSKLKSHTKSKIRQSKSLVFSSSSTDTSCCPGANQFICKCNTGNVICKLCQSHNQNNEQIKSSIYNHNHNYQSSKYLKRSKSDESLTSSSCHDSQCSYCCTTCCSIMQQQLQQQQLIDNCSICNQLSAFYGNIFISNYTYNNVLTLYKTPPTANQISLDKCDCESCYYYNKKLNNSNTNTNISNNNQQNSCLDAVLDGISFLF